jgi:hypothetical protein
MKVLLASCAAAFGLTGIALGRMTTGLARTRYSAIALFTAAVALSLVAPMYRAHCVQLLTR